MSTPEFTTFDYCYALDNAAEFLENEEWPEPSERKAQEAANRAAAKAIRKMSARFYRKHAKTI